MLNLKQGKYVLLDMKKVVLTGYWNVSRCAKTSMDIL